IDAVHRVLGEGRPALPVAQADHRLVRQFAAAGDQQLGARDPPRGHVALLEEPVDPPQPPARKAQGFGLAHLLSPGARSAKVAPPRTVKLPPGISKTTAPPERATSSG